MVNHICDVFDLNASMECGLRKWHALYANRFGRHRKVLSSFSKVMILTCCHDAMPVIGVVATCCINQTL